MKALYIPLILTVAIIINSCEVELDYPEVSGNNGMTMTALAVADENLSVRLSLTQTIDDASADPYTSSYVMWRFLKFGIQVNPKDSLLTADYYNRLLITDAKVTAKVNDSEHIMTYDSKSHNYICAYRPHSGDRITITAKTGDESSAMATVEIPTHSAGIELIGADKVYREREHYSELGMTEGVQFTDSMMLFTIRITDRTSGVNCYRLKVTAVGYRKGDLNYKDPVDGSIHPATEHMFAVSTYQTADPLLYDSGIDKSFGPWPAHQTDVFSSDRLRNGEYVLTVSSRVPSNGSKNIIGLEYGRYFEIELQPISRELFEYLSVLYRLRVATDSYFTEPVTLPSNIEGGVGIFGAIGKSAKIRYWLPGEEDPEVPPTEWKETETGAGR